MKPIIAANWKMHKTIAETEEFCLSLLKSESDFKQADVLICPPFTALAAAVAVLKESAIRLGAQNIHWEQKGAYTGEISSEMLVDLGLEFVIIGHSERRHIMGESDEQVQKKMLAALTGNLKPILCVCETAEERDSGETETVISRQLKTALSGLSKEQGKDLIVAYEPVWAIGTGKAASPDDAEKAAGLIADTVGNILGPAASATLRIQYGGSVKEDNIGSFIALPTIHGALVGGASLEADSFSALIRAAGKAARA